MPTFLLFMQLFLKTLSGKANGVEPDQTSPSGSSLFACAILLETLVYDILGHTYKTSYLHMVDFLLVQTDKKY